MNKSAFVFSLEAFFALVVAVSLVTGIYLILNSLENKQNHPETLSLLSADVLFELDFEHQMLNESRVSFLLDNLIPGQYCARVDVTDQTDLLELSYTKLGCNDTGKYFVITKRSYIDGTNYHIGRLLMWYNG